MFQKFIRAVKQVHRGENGMTGLETAIILIAFVTIATVLAYTVLSAGIFSAEKGKQTIYGGISQASSTLDVKGTVVGYSADNVKLSQVKMKLGLVDPNEQADPSAFTVTFFDNTMSQQLSAANISITKLPGSPERGSATMMEGDEVWELVVNVPVTADAVPYDWIDIQITPPKGATLNIKRTLPGSLSTYTNLY